MPGEPLLEASSLGRIRSLPYEVEQPNGGVRVYRMAPTFGTIAQPTPGGSYRRYQITFRRRTKVAARLVCLAFHGPPPSPRHEVMHRDENSLNNRPANLAWGTRRENHNAPGYLAYCRSRTGDKSPTRIGKEKARG